MKKLQTIKKREDHKAREKNRNSAIKTSVICSIFALAMVPQVAFAGVLSNKFNASANSILGEGQGMVKGALLIIMLVLGGMLIYGGDRMKDSVKARATMTIAGVFCIMAGAGIASTLLGWF